MLSRLSPHVAGEEEAVAVLPLVRLPVHIARCRSHTELCDGRAARCEPQLGIVDEVTDDRDDGIACHGAPPCESYRMSGRSEEHTSELQSLRHLVCRLLLEKKKK